MKPYFAVLGALLILGCKTTEPLNVTQKRFPHTPETPAAEGDSIENDFQIDQTSLVGTWQNGSCGSRQYQRKITFSEDGKFVAVDEIAPCPADATCVSTGITHWHGTWTATGKRVTIEAMPREREKLPDQLPEAYVVVAEDPLSIGEQIGETVCPYRRGE